MTITEALTLGRKSLSDSASPLLDARLLLENSIGRDHSYLVTHPEYRLSLEEQHVYKQRLSRATCGEPVPYILGKAPFYGVDFIVNPAVLIPRPETEHLLEVALNWAKRPNQRGQVLTVVDVGTGSGCLAILLAQRLQDAKIFAIDSSLTALDVARQNATNFDLTSGITFLEGNLMDPVKEPVDLIVANLPYIADDEWVDLPESVTKYEPALALRGGSDGLDLVRALLDQSTSRLAMEGAIFLEIGWRQGEAAGRLASDRFPEAEVKILKDYGGHDRIVSIITPDMLVKGV